MQAAGLFLGAGADRREGKETMAATLSFLPRRGNFGFVQRVLPTKAT
jgi:hypothetical protein